MELQVDKDKTKIEYTEKPENKEFDKFARKCMNTIISKNLVR